MLVLSRAKNTSVSIGEDVLVTVRGFREERVLLEVHCPAHMTVCGPDVVPIGPNPAENDSRESCSAKHGFAAQHESCSRYLARLKVDQTVTVGGGITVMIVALLRRRGFVYRARLGVDAPRHMLILRPDARCAGPRQEPPDDEPSPGG